MAIIPRPQSAPRNPNRRAAPARKPPTQTMLSVAAYRLADELGGRDCDQATRDNAASRIYDFAAKSVVTAWSLVDAADLAVRCYSGRRKVSGHTHDVVGPFRASLDQAKASDLARRAEILEGLKATEDKTSLEAELVELTLRGLPQGRPLRLGPAASEFLLDAMRREFMPVKGSPLADTDFPAFVADNLRFLDWLTGLVFSKEQLTAYQTALDTDKAARAQASATPAPDAAEESDSDVAEDQAASA